MRAATDVVYGPTGTVPSDNLAVPRFVWHDHITRYFEFFFPQMHLRAAERGSHVEVLKFCLSIFLLTKGRPGSMYSDCRRKKGWWRVISGRAKTWVTVSFLNRNHKEIIVERTLWLGGLSITACGCRHLIKNAIQLEICRRDRWIGGCSW